MPKKSKKIHFIKAQTAEAALEEFQRRVGKPAYRYDYVTKSGKDAYFFLTEPADDFNRLCNHVFTEALRQYAPEDPAEFVKEHPRIKDSIPSLASALLDLKETSGREWEVHFYCSADGQLRNLVQAKPDNDIEAAEQLQQRQEIMANPPDDPNMLILHIAAPPTKH